MNGNLAIEIIQPTAPDLVIVRPSGNPWRRFWDFGAAERQVYEDCHSPSTLEAYGKMLPFFLRYLDGQDFALPSPQVMRGYKASLKDKATATINTYLAPAKKFCRFLWEQPLDFDLIEGGRDMFTLNEIQKFTYFTAIFQDLIIHNMELAA